MWMTTHLDLMQEGGGEGVFVHLFNISISYMYF